ncbi:MAG: hypothetical protein ABSA18_09530 [Dehalococcoidia bacterium]
MDILRIREIYQHGFGLAQHEGMHQVIRALGREYLVPLAFQAGYDPALVFTILTKDEQCPQ